MVKNSKSESNELRARLAKERRWAAERARQTKSIDLKEIAEAVGTTQQNINSLLTRIPKYSKFVEPVDLFLKEAVPEYGDRIAKIHEEFANKDWLVDTADELLIQSRKLKNEDYTRREREDMLANFFVTLSQTVKAQKRIRSNK